MQRICIVLHFRFAVDFHCELSLPTAPFLNSFTFIRLSRAVIGITNVQSFGAANASMLSNKEAAYSSNMTFTLFDTPRHYPNRSGWRNGAFYCLS
jgi:hypothetical protein